MMRCFSKPVVKESMVAAYDSTFADIDAKIAENVAKIAENDAKIAEYDAKIAENDAKIALIDSKIASIDARLELPPLPALRDLGSLETRREPDAVRAARGSWSRCTPVRKPRWKL